MTTNHDKNLASAYRRLKKCTTNTEKAIIIKEIQDTLKKKEQLP